MAKIGIIMGPMAPPLKSQLKELHLNTADLKIWQDDMDAISRCYVKGYITETQCDGVYQRLIKRIQREIRKRKEVSHG